MMYRALADRAGQSAEALLVPEIVRRGLTGESAICDVATYVITAEYPAFLGVSVILEKILMAGT
jgi:hypothetical protein